MHAADRMASDKLSEGIQGFTKALEATEALLTRRLHQLESGEALADSSSQIFSLYDLDGDGFITREEWLGTDAVFDAMDIDHDGRISLAELSTALGAVLHLAGTS
jgi:transaldolase